MNKLTSSVFGLLLVLNYAVYAQDIETSTPAKAETAETTVAENPVIDTVAAVKEIPAEAETVPVEESVAASTKESDAPSETVSHQTEDVRRLNNDQIAKMMGLKSPYPHYYPGGLFLRSSYGPSDGVDIGVGFMFALSKSWPVSIGFEPFHLQIAADDFQVVSDETVWLAAVGVVLGSMGPLFKDDASKESSPQVPAQQQSIGTAGAVLAAIAMVPLYFYCGSLYVPVVPGSWLGISDRSRLITQIISEGFHKRSFTYMNDVGLRLSPLASSDGILHGYLDGGIRFEKNFAEDLKIHYFAQVGASLSF